MLATSLHDPNDGMRRRLGPRVPEDHARHLVEVGRGRFLAEAGITAVHPHVMAADIPPLDAGRPARAGGGPPGLHR